MVRAAGAAVQKHDGRPRPAEVAVDAHVDPAARHRDHRLPVGAEVDRRQQGSGRRRYSSGGRPQR